MTMSVPGSTFCLCAWHLINKSLTLSLSLSLSPWLSSSVCPFELEESTLPWESHWSFINSGGWIFLYQGGNDLLFYGGIWDGIYHMKTISPIQILYVHFGCRKRVVKTNTSFPVLWMFYSCRLLSSFISVNDPFDGEWDGIHLLKTISPIQRLVICSRHRKNLSLPNCTSLITRSCPYFKNIKLYM